MRTSRGLTCVDPASLPDALRKQHLPFQRCGHFLGFRQPCSRSVHHHHHRVHDRQLKTLLGAWESTKKEVAAEAKRQKSRNAIAVVNSASLEGLQQLADDDAAAKLRDDKAALDALIAHCSKKADEGLKQFQLAVTRGQKCCSLLVSNSDVQPCAASSKRLIEMLLSNVRNGDEIWHAANSDARKIRRMDVAGNEGAAAARDEFLPRWSLLEERMYALDVEEGIKSAAQLAGCCEEDMEALFRQ